MKLYITGSVGSGKSTLAEQISKITDIKCTHLDNIIFVKDKNTTWGNNKRPAAEIDKTFYSVIGQNDFIIEDTGRERFIDGMRSADKIIVLDIPLRTRKYRIIKRWIKQNLGLEKCGYRPKLIVLKSMFRWIRNYESGKDGTKSRIKQFEPKVIYLRNQKEIDDFLYNLTEKVLY